MNDCYSPHTGEHIPTDNPAPWMGRAGTPAPEYDPVGQSCTWDGSKWVVADVAPDPGPVPDEVTPAQGLMALFALKGIVEDDVLAAIDGIADPATRYQAQVAYNKATRWQRTSATMQAVAALMALTEKDMDDLFRLGITFENI